MSYSKYLKSIFDISIGLILSALFLPLTILLMLAVSIESKGPPIFKQKRIGKNRKEFVIFKIRTMTYSPNNSGTYFTNTNDSRITRIGKLLRISSLDEIPQFWNMLLGNMSLIGPRPDVPAQKTQYTDQDWLLRHTVNPGITGLSQSTFRSQATERNRTRLDLFYATHCCFYLDVVVIIRTFKILLSKGVQN